MPEHKKDGRGFAIYAEIIDTRGNKILVKQSSAYGMHCLYLFCHDPEGHSVVEWVPGVGWQPMPEPRYIGPPGHDAFTAGGQAVTPHLNPQQVRELIAALEAHLKHVEEKQLGFDDDDA